MREANDERTRGAVPRLAALQEGEIEQVQGGYNTGSLLRQFLRLSTSDPSGTTTTHDVLFQKASSVRSGWGW